MQTEVNASSGPSMATVVSLSSWTIRLGVTPVTVWRWRRKGWLKVTNICGRLYLSHSAIADFNERAERGEFAQVHKAPAKKTVGANP
jgi:hypothetical protein